MYCLCGNYNCIIGIRLNDCKVEYVGCLKNEYTFQVDLSISSLVLGNRILYVPGYSRNMHYFDVSKKEDTIIKNTIGDDIFNNHYTSFIKDEDKIYLIPQDGKFILELQEKDSNISMVRTIDIFDMLIKNGINYHIKGFAGCKGYKYKDKFYFPMRFNPFVVEIDLKNNICNALKLEGTESGSCAISGIYNIIYIYNSDQSGQRILIYDIEAKKTIDKIEVLLSSKCLFGSTLIVGNEIIFYGIGYPTIIKFDVTTKNVEIVQFTNIIGDLVQPLLIGLAENNQFVLNSHFEKLILYDIKNNTYKYKIMQYDIENIMKKLSKEVYIPNELVMEYTNSALKFFILLESNNSNNMYNKSSGYIGNIIHCINMT